MLLRTMYSVVLLQDISIKNAFNKLNLFLQLRTVAIPFTSKLIPQFSPCAVYDQLLALVKFAADLLYFRSLPHWLL